MIKTVNAPKSPSRSYITQNPMTNRSNSLETLFAKLPPAETPPGLFDAIIDRIACERQAELAKRKVALFTVFSVISLAAFAAIMPSLIRDFGRSAFFSYVSLAATDPGAMLSIWREYLLSMLEALPAVRLALTALAGLALIASLASLARTAKKLKRTLPAHHGHHSHV